MSRISSSLLTFAASLLTLASCDEKPSLTEPETIAPAAPAFAIAANSWASKASMPTARCLRAAGGLTNASGQAILYAIGGDVKCGSSDPVTSVEAYNVATNTWRTRAPLPARLFELNQAAVIGKKIYVTGGLVEPEFPFSLVSALFVYDQVTNTWTRKSDMPSAGYAVTSGVAGVINGKLYVLNGFTYTPCEGDCGETRPDFYRYDPATDTWISSKDLGRPIPPCPGGHELGSAAVINGKFYVAGGRWGNGISNKLHVYDPVTNSWTEKARPLRRRWGT
ncbi:MAG TPA: kelch repeat-containing protein, partial [Gemmatimonadales bacterium]|nr:kelch repeat-containing protein [Gemmatimonadales bacterium]